MTARAAAAVIALVTVTGLPIGAAWKESGVITMPVAQGADGCEPGPRPARLDFKLKDIRGAGVKLADFKGKVIVLNFWATWCAPCKTEIPDFVDLQARHGAAGLQLLGISVDDSVKQLTPFVEAHNMNYPVLQGRGHNALLDAYAISSLPVTVVIGRSGAMCRRYAGPIAKDVLERQIKSLL